MRASTPGIGYFPFDIIFFEDVKVRRIQLKHGAGGGR